MTGKFITLDHENSLTGTVLSHLLHLPIETFWNLFRHACYTGELPDHVSEPLSIEFWPKWDSEGTGNERYVEPDVFIRFTNFHLIIEAKRWDERMQSTEQWKKEIIAYANHHANEGLPLRMIALGGIWGTADFKMPELSGPKGNGRKIVCPVHMCRWSRLLAECKRMERELAKSRYPSSQGCAKQRILRDVILLFGAHQFQAGSWFADMVAFLPGLDDSLEAHHALLQSLSSRFCKP